MFLTIIISLTLTSVNSVFASDSENKSLKNKNAIECSTEPIIRYIPIKGVDNSALMYAVLINHKKKKYQLISDKNNNIKCIFN